MSKVSVLIPAYNEELSLPELYSKLKEMMDSYAEYEGRFCLLMMAAMIKHWKLLNF